MKKTIKILFFVLTLLFFVSNFGQSRAETPLNLGDFLKIYIESFSKEIPKSYTYIRVKYTNIPSTSTLYNSLQKGIYLDIIPNTPSKLAYDTIINQQMAAKIIKTKFDTVVIPYDKTKPVTATWLKESINLIQKKDTVNIQDGMTDAIYNILKDEYIAPEKMDMQKMRYSAIQGFVDGIGDQYTQFMPPDNAKQFSDDMEGEFEGIGAYIGMEIPGELIINAPIKNSPAEKAGILAGDRIIKIDDTEVTKDMSITQAVKRIKGPEGTSVKLTILRENKNIDIIVTRGKIIVPTVTSELFENNICYIAISMFDMGVYKKFATELKSFSGKNCERYIFDVRNNPGWSLEEVTSMLYHFVPTGETVVTIKERKNNVSLPSLDRDQKLTDKKVIVLINKGSASASEIFAGVIRDYVPNAVLIGEKSFWKWSVQTLASFMDGSVLKYTTAKRYMGKSQTNIDHEGIAADIQVVDNPETKKDEPLEIAKIYKFK